MVLVFLSVEYSRRAGRGASRPSAHATGQHALSGGRVRTRERGRGFGGGRGGRGRGGRDRERQLGGAFGLQSETDPDTTDLPHGAGEIRTGQKKHRRQQRQTITVLFCVTFYFKIIIIILIHLLFFLLLSFQCYFTFKYEQIEFYTHFAQERRALTYVKVQSVTQKYGEKAVPPPIPPPQHLPPTAHPPPGKNSR